MKLTLTLSNSSSNSIQIQIYIGVGDLVAVEVVEVWSWSLILGTVIVAEGVDVHGRLSGFDVENLGLSVIDLSSWCHTLAPTVCSLVYRLYVVELLCWPHATHPNI